MLLQYIDTWSGFVLCFFQLPKNDCIFGQWFSFSADLLCQYF